MKEICFTCFQVKHISIQQQIIHDNLKYNKSATPTV